MFSRHPRFGFTSIYMHEYSVFQKEKSKDTSYNSWAKIVITEEDQNYKQKERI